jgi:hypothetical protein
MVEYNRYGALAEEVEKQFLEDLGFTEENGYLGGPASNFSSRPDHNKIKPSGVTFETRGDTAYMTLDKATAKERKQAPIATGVLDYFPDAIAAVAHLSFVGNEQHNPGKHLHWDRSKSQDHADCMLRHLLQRGTVDSDGIAHSAKVAWRALAALQLEIEAAQKK